jgi:hypothetical protein
MQLRAEEAVQVYIILILIGLQVVIATNTKYHYCIITIKAVQSRELKSVNKLFITEGNILLHLAICVYIHTLARSDLCIPESFPDVHII